MRLIEQSGCMAGSFSKVYRGTLHHTGSDAVEVAVKVMKSEQQLENVMMNLAGIGTTRIYGS